MHSSHVHKDHASAVYGGVFFSSRRGLLVHSESACLSVCEADNLELVPVDGSGGCLGALGMVMCPVDIAPPATR